jgi:serine/threonine protein kinase
VVALKILFPDFPQNDAETQQFTKAMSTALALPHANLVALYAAGKTGPYCWLAQEYIEGKSLAQLLQELDHAPRISWQLGLRVAFHITQALDFTRQHKLIHGNITPKNILIRATDQAALLNDLRLLRALKGSRLQLSVMDQKLTAERTYLAPEQADEGKSYVDFLCDLYSLGAIVYNLITGQSIFESATLAEALEAIHSGTPVRPRKHQKSIPRQFEVVVMRMLAKHQEDRYQSPTEVLDDLHPIIKAYGLKV